MKQQLSINQATELAESYRKRAHECAEKDYQENVKAIAAIYQGLALLDGAGITVPAVTNYTWNWVNVAIEKADLKKVYHAIGRMELYTKEVHDCKKRTITITLKSVNYPSINLHYIDKLPRKAKCKIVTERQKARSYKTLVCSV